MNNWKIKTSLYLNYFVFAILLNSVGILIQKSINTYHVDELKASSLEAFKDLSIAFVSFLIGSFLPRIGYKKGMLIALALVFVGCIGMYYGNSFTSVRILFACVGISFAVIKVSVYSMIGIITSNDKEHKSLLTSIESFFMIGIAGGFVVFPLFYSDTNPDAWLRIYLLLAVLIAASFIILLVSDFKVNYEIPGTSLGDDFIEMIKLLKRPLVLIFAVAAFMYVMTEQGIMSWLPTFNQKVLHLPERTSVFMAVILMLSIALGRYISSLLVKKIDWLIILAACLIGAALMVLFVLPQTQHLEAKEILSLKDVPVIAYVFPLIGFFLAPIYPLVNSFVLSATEKMFHSPMASLLVFFSAIGGTIGSRLVGYLFKHIGGENAFYFSLIPMTVLMICLFFFYRIQKKTGAKIEFTAGGH
ncbi:MAG: major facilitator superfamily permease [Ferruginibacter sp.]|uniref:MFS transporter n=1 Tax=Ferruginibacter sp. TaxID=1940288 RepID=UPI0026581A6F|nr:MFS transporter [Ferruginibacter sp.]MDB5276758.1 major facilitator superfamily permease [Ferruginibacter sp.]